MYIYQTTTDWMPDLERLEISTYGYPVVLEFVKRANIRNAMQ